MFCFHKWKVDRTCYTPPSNRVRKINTDYLARIILEGVTHIYMRCIKCGEFKEDECLGKYVPGELEKK